MEEKRRLLLAEDDIASAEVLTMILDFNGYDVEVTTTAPATLEALRATRFEAVVLDLNMPGMPVQEFVARLALLVDRPPIVVHSASTEREIKATAERIGAAGYVQKPASMERLMSALRDAATLMHGVI